MTPWRALLRWLGALVGVVVVLGGLWLVLHQLLKKDEPTELGPTQRRINAVVDVGDDAAADCSNVGIRRGDPAPHRPLRKESTACVVVGVADGSGDLRWFFTGRAMGDGTVRVPRPTRSGVREVLLENGAVVPIGPSVAVRCSADPNERFETWIAAGNATAAYLDGAGFLVAIDCAVSP